jgi:hypothetical protein
MSREQQLEALCEEVWDVLVTASLGDKNRLPLHFSG